MRHASNWGILLVALGLTLLVSEGVVRLLLPQKLVKPCLEPDNAVGYRYRANCHFVDDWHAQWFTYEVRTNNLGLRMPGDVPSAHADSSWLWLGDSFTFGWGVEWADSWLGLLDSAVNVAHCRLQFINGGHPGWGTSQQIVFLYRMLKQFYPQRVWYAFHETDPFDNMLPQSVFGFRKTEGGGALEIFRRPARRGWRAWLNEQSWYLWLQQHSHLFVLAKQVVTGRVGKERQPRAYADLPPIPDAWDVAQQLTLALVDSLHAICRKAEVPFGVIWLPSMQELALDFPQAWLKAPDIVHFKKRLQAHLLNRAVPFVDLTSAFRQKIDTLRVAQLYYPEAHWRPLGHRLLFESMWATKSWQKYLGCFTTQ